MNNFKAEFEVIQEIVRRFDEVISGKANKFAMIELRHEIEENFVRQDRFNEITKDCQDIIAEHKQLVTSVNNKLDIKTDAMRASVRDLVNVQMRQRMQEYERITKQFSKFFGSEELQYQLDRKVDNDTLHSVFQLKASKKEFD